MKSTLTLLLSSAGRRVELLECFRHDARALGLALRVVATDLAPEHSAACRVADRRAALPRCDSAEFIPRLLALCAAERVDLVVPTIDPELAALARARDAFAALGTRVVVSDPATIDLARDKLRTAAFLAAEGLPVPRTLPAADWRAAPHSLRFPVILKPADGSGSRGLVEVADRAAADAATFAPAGLLAQEKWSGREFTVNLFFDQDGRCRAQVPHERLEVRAGEVSKGITSRHPGLRECAARLAALLPGARGPLCFQAIVAPDGAVAIFELNARFGGGYPLAHRAGARFTRWLLEEAAGRPCTAHDDWAEGVLMLRYDAAVFAPTPGP